MFRWFQGEPPEHSRSQTAPALTRSTAGIEGNRPAGNVHHNSIRETNLKIAEAASCLCLTLALCVFPLTTPAQVPTRRSGVRQLEPNVLAPHLYTNRLKLKLTLINLPGADEPGSYWEASYEIYFISEADFRKAREGAPRGGWNPTPADFPGRILLGRGKLRRTSLRTISDRTYLSRAVALKAKVPSKSRTKFATILTSYSIKIFDARLKRDIYRSGTFAATPFVDGDAAGGNEVARTMLYANFHVSPTGFLSYSQWARDPKSTNWP